MKIATIFLAKILALVNPSENNKVSAINSLSGTDIATGLNNYLRLSGNLDLPPYPFPAGFKVTKIPAFLLTVIKVPNKSKVSYFSLIAN